MSDEFVYCRKCPFWERFCYSVEADVPVSTLARDCPLLKKLDVEYRLERI